MLKFLRLTTAPCLVLLALMSGCSAPEQTQNTSSTPTSSLSTEPVLTPVTSTAPSLSPQTDPFQDASDKAIGAATISQSAQSALDWNLVAGMWQEAINLMKAVPKSSSTYALAQKKVVEYQHNLAVAKKNEEKPPQVVKLASDLVTQNVNNSPKVVEPASQISVSQSQATLPQTSELPAAKEFLEAYFQATVNGGSRGYEYWCSKSADFRSSLFAPRGWQILKADNDYGLVRVDSSNKGGSQVTANWNFYLDKETDPKHTGLPRGLCISLMSEQ